MSPENNLATQRMNAGENFTSGTPIRGKNNKAPTTDQPPAMKCPRCDSTNTKFCYYNNYSLTQPRHFCKTCRRYWTKGGALRNVPIGGGCRKNKKVIKSSLRLTDSKDSGSSNSEITGLRFLNGLSTSAAMDFQLPLPFSRINNASASGSSYNNHFGVFSLEQSRNPNFFASSLQSPLLPSSGGVNGGGLNVDMSLASSIESLSSINQDLHWKLQQQRLAMLFEGGDANDNNNNNHSTATHNDVVNGFSSTHALELDHHNRQKLQPIPFQNLEISKPDHQICNSLGIVGSDSAPPTVTDHSWFFGNSYAAACTSPVTTMTTAPNISGGVAGVGNGGGSLDDEVQEWNNDLHHHQYSRLE